MAKKRLTVLEAVDNLSTLAELDVEKKEETAWLDLAELKNNEEKIKETFRTLNEYLRHLYQKERAELKNPETMRGLQAMMQLAGEAMDKVGRYTHVFKETISHEQVIPEYRQLQHFYLSKIVTRKEKDQEEVLDLNLERQALKDLESVRGDHEYELFYIRKEDGMPFFHHNLLRNIRLVGNFDETLLPTEIEGPYTKMQITLDRDFHNTARDMLEEGSALFREFCQEAMKFKEMTFISSLNKSLMALMLAANPRNLIHNTSNKHCIDYFVDFETYLRETMLSEDYLRFIASSSEKIEPFFFRTIKLIHALCSFLFLRKASQKEILDMIEKLSEDKELPSMWGSIIAQDEALRSQFKRYPSGPLLQILMSFRHDEEKMGFDPLLQHNIPSQLFHISSEDSHITFLHLPCPIHQEFIDKPQIVLEFKGFLRDLSSRKLLIFNLQDRTSWKEHSRSTCLEDLQKEAEFKEKLQVVTLAKNTDFYHQAQIYSELSDAAEFIEQLKEQIASKEQCGFYFPSHFKEKLLDPLLDFIHTHLFEQKKDLSRKERLDFIEIFYFFFSMKIISDENPDIVSFSCKDGIDTGAAASAAFFGFARLLSNKAPWTEAEKHFFLYALESPALLLRHRPIDSIRFHRALSALDHFQTILESNREKIITAGAKFFPAHLKVQI